MSSSHLGCFGIKSTYDPAPFFFGEWLPEKDADHVAAVVEKKPLGGAKGVQGERAKFDENAQVVPYTIAFAVALAMRPGFGVLCAGSEGVRREVVIFCCADRVEGGWGLDVPINFGVRDLYVTVVEV